MPAMSGMMDGDADDPDASGDTGDNAVSAAQIHTSSSLLIISVLSLFLRFS